MNRELKISRKIQVKKSPIEGFGVFATEDIEAANKIGEVLIQIIGKTLKNGNRKPN